MGIREDVKSGKLSVSDALANLAALRKGGFIVGSNIIRWLERHRGKAVVEKPATQPSKNKGRNKAAA